MYLGLLFDFLNSWFNSVFKLSVTSRKSINIIFVVTITDRPHFVNTSMTNLFFCSILDYLYFE